VCLDCITNQESTPIKTNLRKVKLGSDKSVPSDDGDPGGAKSAQAHRSSLCAEKEYDEEGFPAVNSQAILHHHDVLREGAR
jgi:hypothetical protein